MDTKEVEMMKDGARRVQAHLATHGVEIKHSVLLEALSAGFGARNWRTVREKLNAPSAPEPKQFGSDGWMVHAVYCDNNQPYADEYSADTPLEASVIAQVERMMDPEGAEVDVADVVCCATGQFGDHYSGMVSSKIFPHATALYMLAQWANTTVSVAPPRESTEAYLAWVKLMTAIEDVFLKSLNPDSQLPSVQSTILALNTIDASTCEEPHFTEVVDEGTVFLMDDGSEFTLWPAEGLRLILDHLTKEGIDQFKAEERLLVYHARALLEYAEDELDYVLA